MGSSPYAAPLGRLKAQALQFLPKEAYAPLVNAADVAEVAKLLEPTVYGSALAQYAATYSGSELLEVAVNQFFVQRNRMAIAVAPFAGRPVLVAYLRRWDIQNIGAILSAKAQGRSLSETGTFLVSSREIPAGLLAGSLTLDDFRLLIQAPTVEAVANQLVRYGYGATLLPLLDAFAQKRDVFPLLQALDRQYFADLLESTRFFQGDEWTVRRFIQSEIDLRNALVLLKGKNAAIHADAVMARFFEGGEFPRAAAQEMYATTDGVPALVGRLAERFPRIGEGQPRFDSDHSLVGFEVVLTRERAIRELHRLRTYPLSLAVIFAFLLLAELERNDLQRIVYAKVYGVAADDVRPLLVSPQL
jgi:V/A-type H+/Na+-transporting ATPase subunit C